MMEKKPLTVQKKTGILSSSITLIVVICLILLNAAAAVITEKYPVKLDLTPGKAFQLSQTSIAYLETLDKPVKFTVMNTRDNFVRGGDYFTQAISVMEQYGQYNGNITIEYVDILSNPTYTAQYPNMELTVNDILVRCGDNTEKLTAYDLFNVESSWYSNTITSSKAEQAMTGAIMNVTNENKIRAAFLTGHEEAGDEALEELLKKNGFETVRASLLTEGVPEDAAVAVMAAPLRDITEGEAAALDKFLENGGNYGKSLFYFASLNQPQMPVLEKWLAKWGLAVGEGAVAETEPSRIVNQNLYFGLASFDDTALTGKMTTTEIPMGVPFARPVEFTFSSNLGYATKTLLSYSEKSGLVGPETQNVSDIPISGPVPVAGMSTLSKDGKQSSVILFGSEVALDSSLLESGSFSNADYLLSAVNTLTNRERSVSIAPKVLGGGYIAITMGEVLVFGIVLAMVLPLAVLGAGLYIWTRRRRR